MKYILHSNNGKLMSTFCAIDANKLVNQINLKKGEYKIVDIVDMVDHSFFDAYEFDQEAGAKINISKVKRIQLDHYRRARTPLLASLDVDFMRAVESNNTALQKEIATKKQALRDVTKTELPDSLEGIKNTWPEILGKKPF